MNSMGRRDKGIHLKIQEAESGIWDSYFGATLGIFYAFKWEIAHIGV